MSPRVSLTSRIAPPQPWAVTGRIRFGQSEAKAPQEAVAPPKPYAEPPLLLRALATGCWGIEYAGRSVINWLGHLGRGRYIQKVHDQVMQMPEHGPEFLQAVIRMGRYLGQGKEIDINLEDGRLQSLAQSDEACIFIMNHDSQKHDPALLGAFLIQLYEEYLRQDKGNTCPTPKILVNKDILTTQPKAIQAIFEKIGALGVDASIVQTQAGKAHNQKILKPVVEGFCGDKNHIFIFPEGKRAVFQYRDLRDRFHNGVASLVRNAAMQKKQVKVVPIGFAYKRRLWGPNLNSMHIGQPVYFTWQNGKMLVNPGNMTPKTAPPPYAEFFWDTPIPSEKADTTLQKPLMENGIPVTGKRLVPLISAVLCENLRICRNAAQEQLVPKTVQPTLAKPPTQSQVVQPVLPVPAGI